MGWKNNFRRFWQTRFSADKNLINSLKNILGFYPNNIALYKQAFRHSSIAKNIKEGVKDSNERLEYLGDAILGAVVSDFLFKTFPYKDEGFLTKMRSKIVNRASLNQIAIKIGLNKFIQQNIDRISFGSSINGDAFEALIGAIYIDKGYFTAQQFILHRIIKNHIDMEEVENKETDFKSKLIEFAQKEKKELKFNLIETTSEGNEKKFNIEITLNQKSYANAKHFSKKRAEQMAAEETLVILSKE